MEKIDVATKYHDIVWMLDTHLSQDEVDVMIKENKTFFQDFHDPLLIPSQTRELWCWLGKRALSEWSTQNSLSVKIVSASNQELEIAFVYKTNDEIEKLGI